MAWHTHSLDQNSIGVEGTNSIAEALVECNNLKYLGYIHQWKDTFQYIEEEMHSLEATKNILSEKGVAQFVRLKAVHRPKK